VSAIHDLILGIRITFSVVTKVDLQIALKVFEEVARLNLNYSKPLNGN
jgi:hypothetical protein